MLVIEFFGGLLVFEREFIVCIIMDCLNNCYFFLFVGGFGIIEYKNDFIYSYFIVD